MKTKIYDVTTDTHIIELDDMLPAHEGDVIYVRLPENKAPMVATVDLVAFNISKSDDGIVDVFCSIAGKFEKVPK